MGNYRQHIAFASTLGVGYGAAAYLLMGLHWLYGTVAALLSTIGGLLPDLDSPSGVELKGFTGILGVLGAVAVWQEVGLVRPPPAFELHLWLMVITYVLIRHGMRGAMSRLTVHRGISHSFPTMVVWAETAYLYYPSPSHPVRLMMGAAVGLGFFSHLLLDEICSVDLKGARVNKAFGTAMKFWAPSIWSTLAMYALLSFLTNKVIQQWPDEPFVNPIHVRLPVWPSSWPKFSSSSGYAPASRTGAEAEAEGEPDSRPPRRRGAKPARPSDAGDDLDGFPALKLPGSARGRGSP